jgi:hypothetical protein
MSEVDFSFWEFDPLEQRLSDHIEIPPEPDSQWCDFISEYYGKGYFKVSLRADFFIREKIVNVGSALARHLKDPEDLRDKQGVKQAHEFIGIFAGLELQPKLEGQEYNQGLFANLLDVVDVATGEVITGPDDVALLVPVEQRVITLVQC